MHSQKSGATLADLAQLYRYNGPSSAPACLNALGLVIRRTTGREDWQALSISIINGDTARQWFEDSAKKARGADQARAQQIHRTARSTFAQARAVVCPRMLEVYTRAGLELQHAAAFLEGAKKHAPRVRNDGTGELPADDVINRMLAEWRAWPADPARRNEFAAVGLMLSCGLRKSEVAQARWSWINERHGAPVLSSRADVKNGSGHLEVVPLNPFWTDWRAGLPAAADPSAYILEGSTTERTDETFRRVGAWLRSLGWNTEKTNHALRDYSASLITMKYGLNFAKAWCRHASSATTERSYNRFVDPVVMVQRADKLSWLSFAGEKK